MGSYTPTIEERISDLEASHNALLVEVAKLHHLRAALSDWLNDTAPRWVVDLGSDFDLARKQIAEILDDEKAGGSGRP